MILNLPVPTSVRGAAAPGREEEEEAKKKKRRRGGGEAAAELAVRREYISEFMVKLHISDGERSR